MFKLINIIIPHQIAKAIIESKFFHNVRRMLDKFL